jgi:hypothetical protein
MEYVIDADLLCWYRAWRRVMCCDKVVLCFDAVVDFKEDEGEV